MFQTTPKKNHPVREEPLPPTQISRAIQELNIARKWGEWSAASRRRKTGW
jgi:hypothetical protein